MEKAGIQAIRLTDLADYQEGSIVSRTIVEKRTGTVTFFAFDEGQGLSEHTAPFDALVYLLDGEAEIVISGKPFRLKGGE
ncbi:MAG: cupin domain-containing protein, partial [Thermodesulfobacteriota bacterium]